MKKIINFYISATLFFITSCTDGNVKSFHENYTVENNAETEFSTEVDTIYMHTGFYNVVGEGKGVSKRQEKSDEIYDLSPMPFVSVKDINKAELQRTKIKEGVYNQLCLTFNDTGKENLREGTGSGKYAKIACVIANRLLFVVENKNTIDGGNMCIGLVNYSEKEMQTLLSEVRDKK